MRAINVNVPKRRQESYPIRIEKGIVTRRKLPRGFVITDANVFNKYRDLIGGKEVFVINAGEQSKSLETYVDILKCIPEDTERIIAFGGGVVGDLAGFAASTHRRGIQLIQAPTTLLAMVDSSIGGKNGVNVSCIKNNAGTFYQPEIVLIDPLFLKTLPVYEFKNGVAEIIKYGFVLDEALLQRALRGISQEDKDLEKIIYRCCKIKAEVVEKDERDEGYRHVLNFGHTIGHAIEILFNLPHGQAISQGMVYEARLGNEEGIVSKEKLYTLIEALRKNGLETEIPLRAHREKILRKMESDKKGRYVFAFDKEHYAVKVKESDIREVIKPQQIKCY